MLKIRKKKFTITKAVKPGETQNWIPFFCPKCSRKLRASEKEYAHIKPCPACKEKITYPDPSFGVGQLIADYMLDGWIDHGSMGEVYMAHNINTQQKVALKLLNSQISTEDGLALFKQETDILSYFKHQNIITQNGSGEFYGCYYLAMNYVEGECLDKLLLRHDLLPEKLVLSIIRQTADAMNYVTNTFGIRHRDLKPGNLMIDEDWNVTVIDWGMAKQKFHKDDNQVHGSPLFVDPVAVQQASGLDARSDIYSMGVTCFYLLTGEYPFIADDVDALIDKVLTEPAPSARSINCQVSKNTSLLIDYMLKKTYEERYQNWQEVINGVDEALATVRS